MFDPYFLTVAVITVLIVGFSKSGLMAGMGMIAVPILTLVMPARDAAGMMLPVLLSMDVMAVWVYRKEVDWRILRIMIPGALFGTLIGWILWAVVSDAAVLLFVGVVTFIFVLDALLPLRKRLEGLPPSTFWGRFWGVVAGFTSFVSHTGAPPYQIYTLPQRLPPPIYAGTSSYFFFFVNIAKLVPYFFLGQLNVSNLARAAVLAPVGMLGVFLGVLLVRRISVKQFYGLAYTLILFLSLKLIWDGATALIAAS